MRLNRGHDLVGVGQCRIVGKANDRPAGRFQIDLSDVIPDCHVVELMDPAVNLDHQSQWFAGEVRDISPDRMLAPEFVPVDPAASKQGPYLLLGQA